jgi:stage III sporulation protein AD
MELIKIIGIAFVTVITSILIKSTKPELSFAVTVTGVIVILLFILDGLQGTIILFNSISQTVGVDNQLIKILLKIIGVGYITEFASGILNDFGGNTISDKVVLGGKITILLLSMPIIENLLQILKGFVHLL